MCAFAASLAAIGCARSHDTASGGPGAGGSTAQGGAAQAGNSAKGGAGGAAAGNSSTGIDVTVQTKLPPLPKLSNVVASAVDDNVDITFDPVDGARDYRVYPLPADADITTDSSGYVSVNNAVYRCAGDRQAPAALVDGQAYISGLNVSTLVDGQSVGGYTRTLDEATLGYVYTTPGPDRVPVYALGDSAPDADDDCVYTDFVARWGASRVKVFTASESERTDLLGKSWRDDGIVFYAPSTASSKTRSVYTLLSSEYANPRYYYVDGPEATLRGKANVAFQALTTADTGTQPLMRVFYKNICGRSHDELVAGKSRFERARRQGDQQPVYDLHWAGLTGETTLVVEALDTGCPYQGFFAPISAAARDPYPEWLTLDQLHKASPTGEVFINGQHDAASKPKAVARSFVKISPGPRPDMDWFLGFGSADELGTLKSTDCAPPSGSNCWQQFRQTSSNVDISFMLVDSDHWAFAPILGELWIAYADVGADVNGKFRLTPVTKPQFTADKFLHATMTVDTFTTGRRYPQILISDQDVPVQNKMTQGYAIVVQTFGSWANAYQVEVCNHQYWDVNQQCPAFDLYHVLDPTDSTHHIGLAPNAEVAEHSGMDRGTRFDVYSSTKRIYLLLDGQPYGCADLPSASVPAGPVTVTYGDVLYHSGVDHTFTYTGQALQVSTRRHLDNLGYKAGVDAPTWDEKRFPCATVLK